MSRIILVTGGARSGKSTYAESLYAGKNDVVYIATSRADDAEMRERIKRHQQSRSQEWDTFEGTYQLHNAIGSGKHYLLDCLGVLTSNVMFDLTKNHDRISPESQTTVEEQVLAEIRQLIQAVKQINGTLVMVTNEVGYSVVPVNHLARVYRDILGRINQRIAALSDEVYLVACGLPLQLK